MAFQKAEEVRANFLCLIRIKSILKATFFMLQTAVAAFSAKARDRNTAANRVLNVRSFVQHYAAQSAERLGTAMIHKRILEAEHRMELCVCQCVTIAERTFVNKDLILTAQQQLAKREALGKRILSDIFNIALSVNGTERRAKLECTALDIKALFTFFKADTFQ